MRLSRWLMPALAVGIAASLGACESSQDRSAALAKHGATALKQAPGLKLGGTTSSVKVLDSAVVSGKDSSAAVVTLKNEGSQALVDLPIAINVLDAKGKKVFTNTTPGLQKALQSMPVLEPGQTADWVNDQILTSSPPKSLKVTVGSTKNTTVDSKIDPAALTVSKPKLSLASAIGPEANGTLVNKSSTELDQVLLFAVARKGGKVVAAGRGGVKKVRTGGKPANYHIFFKGDPRGADITVTDFPNKLE
jgi:hypothetical protein